MNVRKFLCVILLAIALAGCGDGGNKGTATPSGYPAPQQPAATPTLAAYPTP
jgi:hypothetical protein